MPTGEIVFDTSCILWMTRAGREDLLATRYEARCYLPDEVIVEIRRGESEHGFNCDALLRASWWKPLAVTEPDDQKLFFELLRRWGKQERHRGEAATIVLAYRLGCTCLDDLQGRKAAHQLGVPVVGTVGILARITAEGHLDVTEGWAIHSEMLRLGFRSHLRTYDEFRQVVSALQRV